MKQNTLNAVLLSVAAVVAVYSVLRATLLLGVAVIGFLFVLSLCYRLLTAVERIADNTDRLVAAADGGGSGPARGGGERRSDSGSVDDDDRPPVEERSTDELFE